MPNRLKWIAVGLLCCGFTCLVIRSCDDEPRYRGRSLGKWVQRYGDPDTKEEAADAIVRIATNQASALVRLLDYDPNPRRNAQISRVEKMPTFLLTRPWVYSWMFPADNRELLSSAALSAFEIAGAHGERAVPELTKLMLSGSSECAAMNAAQALAYVGGPGRIALVMNATNRESPARLYALRSLASAWGYPEEARKVVFAALTDPDPRIREVATNAARRYWPEYRGIEF